MELLGEGGRATSYSLYCSFFLLRSLSKLPLSFLPSDGDDCEEWEERNSLPHDWRGRSLALLTRLTAWSARLEPLWFIGKEEWIFIRNCEIVASLLFFLLLARAAALVVLSRVSPSYYSPRERERRVQFSVCIPFASRFSRFLDTVRSFSEHYEIIRLFPASANVRAEVQLPNLLLKRGIVSLYTIP